MALLPAQKKIQQSLLKKEMQKSNPQTGGLITKDEVISNAKGGKDYKTYHLTHNGNHLGAVRAEAGASEAAIKAIATKQKIGNSESIARASVMMHESTSKEQSIKNAIDASLKESLFSWFKSGKTDKPAEKKPAATAKKVVDSKPKAKVDLYPKGKKFSLPSVNDRPRARSEAGANMALAKTAKGKL
jgi:hypothetical protein